MLNCLRAHLVALAATTCLVGPGGCHLVFPFGVDVPNDAAPNDAAPNDAAPSDAAPEQDLPLVDGPAQDKPPVQLDHGPADALPPPDSFNCGSCALGCAALGTACASYIPSNLYALPTSYCNALVATNPHTFKTTKSDCGLYNSLSVKLCGGTWGKQIGGVYACVIGIKDLVIKATVQLDVVGDHPLILVAQNSVKIDGTINAGAVGATPGPGGATGAISGDGAMPTGIIGPEAKNCNCSDSGNDDCGGGGGGFGSGGGGGSGGLEGTSSTGTFCSGKSPGGQSYGVAALTPLIGGSSGASGHSVYGALASGGGGGGALQISAQNELILNGVILVGGGGGAGAPNIYAADPRGGGGGGAGGAVLLEAARIKGGGLIAAGGGGGGGGSDGQAKAGSGLDAPASTSSAGGGAGVKKANSSFEVGNGGNGAALGYGAVSGKGTAIQGGAGGGGGGMGRIRLNWYTAKYPLEHTLKLNGDFSSYKVTPN